MSYFYNVNTKTEIIASLIKLDTPTTTAAGGRFSLSGTVNGSASIVSNRLRLVAGSSYYIEASAILYNPNASGSLVYGVYDQTNSVYLHECISAFDPTLSYTKCQRYCTSALILDSDITTTMDVEIRIQSIAGSGWDLTVTANGIGPYNFVGYPSLRLLELPS